MRKVAAAVLVLLALPPSGGAHRTGGTAAAVVALPLGEVRVVELRTSAVLWRTRVPAGAGDVAATADGRRVLLSAPRAGSVTLVDVLRRRVLKVFRGLGSPGDVLVSADGRRGYVLDGGRSRLVVLDLARRRVAGAVAVPGGANRLVVSDGFAWVAGSTRSLGVVDVRTARRPLVVGSLAAGGRVAALLHVPDSAWLLVAYRGSSRVGKLDAGARRIVFRRDVGAPVGAIGSSWATPRVWLGHRDGRVTVLAYRTGRVVRRLRLGAAAGSIGGVAGSVVVALPRSLAVFSDDGRRIATTRLGARIGGVDYVFLP